ncbi:MAG: class II glutamine amidotransferase [Alphaproteobacteria bacterium]|nr:class II glutamine amidotransferase [Alphaproteobacteria bacterium]
MCRWLAYSGPPIHPDTFLFEAENSLIRQSLSAQLAVTPINGDGFGLGWYGVRSEPGLFRDVLPAWNDENLKCVAEFAHVRASTGAGISRSNCHPFRYGKWMFMHNGQIGGYAEIRHELDRLIAPAYYRYRQGGTDSETFFYILLSNGLESDPQAAFARTVAQIEAVMSEAGISSALRLTAAATDGEIIHAIRYASDDRAPTLYFGLNQTDSKEGSALMILSEPLNSQPDDWREIPMSRFITACGGAFDEMTFAPQSA